MSKHTLVLVADDVPADDRDAWRWLEQFEESLAWDQPDKLPPPSPRFLPVLTALLNRYPDIDSYGPDDLESCVWAEGPMKGAGIGCILDVTVSGRHRNQGIEEFVIAQAQMHGLTVMDTETSAIYRAP